VIERLMVGAVGVCLGAAFALHPMTRPILTDPRATVRVLVAVAVLFLIAALLM